MMWIDKGKKRYLERRNIHNLTTLGNAGGKIALRIRGGGHLTKVRIRTG